jgi:hypothetical protein
MEYIYLVIIVIAVAFWYYGYNQRKKINDSVFQELTENSKKNSIDLYIDNTLTISEPFGYKISWLAIRSTDREKIINYFNRENKPCFSTNWNKGINAAYNGFTFITPVIDDWIFVISPDIGEFNIEICRNELEDLSNLFAEIHYYHSFRGASYAACAKFIEGKLIRGFITVDGENEFDEGEKTAIEQTIIAEELEKYKEEDDMLNWINESNGIVALADEDAVMRIAGAWSINPQHLAKYKNEELGTLINKQENIF